MKQLPKGYYAVIPTEEGAEIAKSFSFKGEEYAVTPGENAFATMPEAYEAANQIPDEVLQGLSYEKFEAPVLLFAVGRYKVDKFTLTKSCYFLGQKAGVDPNVWGENKWEAPAQNHERGEGESELYGSYWNGKMTAVGAEAELLLFDGFSNLDARYVDSRKEGKDLRVVFRNILHYGYSGHTLYLFSGAFGFDLHLQMQNIRLADLDDFEYGENFVRANAASTLLENICFCRTGQLFGLTGYSRYYTNCSGHEPCSEYTLRHCYFGELRGENGLATTCRTDSDRGVKLNVEDSVFLNASRSNQSAITPHLANGNCALFLKNCAFRDTRGNSSAAVSVLGEGENMQFENCTAEGFAELYQRAPAPITEAPDRIGEQAPLPQGEPIDLHTVEKNGDFSALDEMYKGRTASYGDLHVHSNSGGTSDGRTPIENYVADMDKQQLDFVALVDHRQMRGFFLPAWDENRFIIGTEPGTRITDLKACRYGQSEIHYNMLFPHKYALAMVLANFPEFEFQGDELTGNFKYPKFTVARFLELSRFVQSLGGIMVHPHPKTMMASYDPLDYYECFGEHTFIETLYEGYESPASAHNYDLWVQILAAGKHMYTACGSDTHGAVTNSTVATFYTKEKNGLAFFNQMHSADFTAGAFGIQMEIDGNPMGSEIAYRKGQILNLRVKDAYAPALKENNVYELRVYSDKGLCYSSRFNGKCPQQLSLKLKKRKFYRAEVVNITRNYRIAIGNPIWLDKEV